MIKKIRKFIVALALVFTCLLSCLPFGAVQVFAEGINVDGGYTNVLDDLKKDENFNETLYPVIENNYKLEVITISESVDKELFVYVYQPNPEHGKYVASSINISATDDNSLDIMNYPLTLVNYDGVFQKYLVMGVTLPTSGTRYYEVISIYRVFDENIDEGLSDDNDNTINEVVFKVGKLFTLTDTENGVSVNVNDTETIKVTEKYVGFMRYPSNSFEFGLGYESFDVHYVAFSTDREIDDLLETDVYYETQSVHRHNWSGDEFGAIEKGKKSELKKEDNVLVSGTGWFSNTYKWSTIETGKTFVDSEHATFSNSYGLFNSTVTTKMTSEDLANYIGKCDWVLRFAVTEYKYWENGKGDESTHDYTIVSNVSILRLKFETDGKIYNLGVVDNKQTGSLTPDNETKTELTLNDTFKIIIALLALILVLFVLAPFLPIIFSFIGGILKLVFRIITLPFRILFGGKR